MNNVKTGGSTACLWLILAGGVQCQQSSPSEYGPAPDIISPQEKWLPTVNIAKAVGWGESGAPASAKGTQVSAIARGLAHPRWLYVLPNGDVLAAESEAPARPDEAKGLMGKVGEYLMKRAGSGTNPSANRITLLREAQDGTHYERHVFLEGLNSPIGMALIGGSFFVADTDAVLRFPYKTGDTEIRAQP